MYTKFPLILIINLIFKALGFVHYYLARKYLRVALNFGIVQVIVVYVFGIESIIYSNPSFISADGA